MGITKTVYNPAARKPSQRTSEEALKKKQVRSEGDDGKVGVVELDVESQLETDPVFAHTGGPKTTAGCEEEETGDIGEAH